MVADLVGVGLAVSKKNKSEANFSLFHYPQAPSVIPAHHSATFVFMVPSDDSFENTLMLGKIEGGRRRG